MAAISLFSSSLFLRARRGTSTQFHSFSSASTLPRRHQMACLHRSLRKNLAFKRTVMAVAEEETLATAEDPPPSVERAPSADEAVIVPVSPSDALTMFFKAEGTMDDTAMSKVSKALEAMDGVGDLKVQNVEGIASVVWKGERNDTKVSRFLVFRPTSTAYSGARDSSFRPSRMNKNPIHSV